MPKAVQITSTQNPLVKRIRGLAERDAREAEGRMVVEGARMIEEVLEAGVPVELLLYDPLAVAGPRGEALLERARRQGVRLVTAAPHVVAACSQVETSQGVVAVVERPRPALSDLLNLPDLFLVVADRIQDPAHLGTIIRIADAAGATAVLATRGTVDPHNPKAVRATMGSDRKSTRLNSSHLVISYAVFCLKKKKHTHCRLVHAVMLPDNVRLVLFTPHLATPTLRQFRAPRAGPSAPYMTLTLLALPRRCAT